MIMILEHIINENITFAIGKFNRVGPSPIQNLVMDKARAAIAPTLAAAVNIGLFDLGTGLAAWLYQLRLRGEY